jgi:hypothetical protein
VTYAESKGISGLFTCSECGAAVADKNVHTRWHEALARVASDASWATTLRPIGGYGLRGSDRSPAHRMCMDPECMDDTPHLKH